MRTIGKRWIATLWLTTLGWLLPHVGMTAENSDCFACHSDKELSKKGAGGKTISLFVDEAKYTASTHGKQNCTACHKDTTETPHPDGFKAKLVDCSECHKGQSDTYGASIHGIAHKNGDGKAASCHDCHGTHDVLPIASPRSPLNRQNLAATCGRCHTKAAEDVKKSVHGKAFAKGEREAPTCTDCHSEHKIEKLVGAAAMKISEDVCSRCHSSERINTKFNIPADRVETFRDSYHGLAARLGSVNAANCASCHGWHDVLPSSDPESRISAANLAKTCGECHPGIGTRLAHETIRIHAPPGAAVGKHWIVNFVSRFYIVIIFVTIGAMLVHNFIDYFKKTRDYLRQVRNWPGEFRFSRLARTQHFTLLVLFILLAYTGFVHKYPEAMWSWPFKVMHEGNYVRGIIHSVAGWAFVGLLIVHCILVVGTSRGRVELKALWLRVKDWNDLWATMAYNLGVRKALPTRERFNYAEKSEYWALMWGSVVMIVTGIMLIFTEVVLHFLPQVWLDVAQVVHYYEAVLATLAIVVWHFYAVIFDPHEYPMNPVWLTGKKPPLHDIVPHVDTPAVTPKDKPEDKGHAKS